MRLIKNKKISNVALAALMALSALTSLGFSGQVHATSLTQTMVRFDRMQTSAFTSGMVCAMPNTTATEGKIAVTFPTGFTVSGTTANWTTSVTPTSSWPSSSTPWITIGATATSVSGQTVTWTSGDLTPAVLYCFNWTDTTAALKQNTSVAASETGTVATELSAGTVIDSSSFATATISPDQIAVSATVSSVFSFALTGGTTDNLGALSTASVSHSGTAVVATIGTNAKNGYSVWAKSANANGGLKSTAASYTIPSTCNAGTQIGTNTTLVAGTEGYNTGVVTAHSGGGGTLTGNAVFDGSSTSKGGGLCGTYQALATSTGTAGADTLTMTNNVAISTATAIASDYADTITVVGAGLF